MNDELTEMHRKAVELDVWMQRHGIDEIGPIARRDELIRLRDWKESMLTAMNPLDLQGTARLLGAKPGDDCYKIINDRVPLLVKRTELVRDAAGSVATWWVMIEAQNELVDEKPIPDDAVILHFMGSGASHMVTAKDLRDLCQSLHEEALEAQ